MPKSMRTWFKSNLGDAMLAGESIDHVKALFLSEYEKAGRPAGMAVFIRHESEGRLHCEAKVYFSPASAVLAKMVEARPCEKPSSDGLDLLAGSAACFTDSGAQAGALSRHASPHARPRQRTRMAIRLKRVYEPPGPQDGFRILVDRLWPRGTSKNSAHIDLWLKDVAPSTSLRKWFGHDPSKWVEFRDRYFLELDRNREAVEQLDAYVHRGMVTIVYAAKDTEFNAAVVLKAYIENPDGPA